MDRSTGIDASHAQTRKEIFHFIKEFNLIDIWRKDHPDKVIFSCYSSTCQTFSRIDFLVSANLTSIILDSWYDSIVISDHVSVSFNLKTPKALLRPTRWRLQSFWLKDPDFLQCIGAQIDCYFIMNTHQTSAAVRWDAFKAFLRGQMISYTSFKHKSWKEEMKQLELKIKNIQTDYFKNPSEELFKELNAHRAKYNVLSINKATKSLMKLKQSYYEQGEKASELLAWCIKQLETERTINTITTDEGLETSDPQEINRTFRTFYEKLYYTECSSTAIESQKEFLDSFCFASLDDDAIKSLNLELIAEDLSLAISSMKGAKCPGPDGIPIEIYKIFKDKLITPLLDMNNESLNNGSLPPSLNMAEISLLLKIRKTIYPVYIT